MTCCNSYAPQYDPENDEIACTYCGTVNNDETSLARSLNTKESERQSSASTHSPVNYLMIDEIGSQQDMVSPWNRGVAMDLGPGSNARDADGKKCKPILKEAYVTGQVVGKGSAAIFDEEGKIRAKSDYHFDKMYRRSKIMANDKATRLGFGPIERRFFGKELDKMFCEFGINLGPKAIATMALIRMTKYKGLPLDITSDIIDEYLEVRERMRQVFTQFDEVFLVSIKATTK